MWKNGKCSNIPAIKVSEKGSCVYADAGANVVKKSGSGLLEIDVYDKEKTLSRKSVFIGQKCT